MAKITGNGTTIAFGTTTTWTPDYISIGGLSPSREFLETTDLGDVPSGNDASVYKSYIPGDTVDPGEIACQVFWEPEDGFPPILEAAETVTLTYPNTDASTVAFSGAVKSFSISEAVNDQLLLMDLVLQPCGAPTFTL